MMAIGGLSAGVCADWLGAPGAVVALSVLAVVITGTAWMGSRALRRLQLSKLVEGT